MNTKVESEVKTDEQIAEEFTEMVLITTRRRLAIWSLFPDAKVIRFRKVGKPATRVVVFAWDSPSHHHETHFVPLEEVDAIGIEIPEERVFEELAKYGARDEQDGVLAKDEGGGMGIANPARLMQF
ncbi:MAG TPA: hypothetical protein P5555_05490 [Candidatus Paceibacterota bacterium]|nr:hypothetical protein [Verrucomicrobiota bacterium]HRZ44623.1 hypothetical protein [Candidatus Paceibacterota bacterium]